MLTPSSNTVVEPVTTAIVRDLPHVTAHFARFPVTEISLKPHALSQFDREPFLDAARLLADARMDAIAWNGTSAAWMGFEADDRLCAAIEAQFEVAAHAVGQTRAALGHQPHQPDPTAGAVVLVAQLGKRRTGRCAQTAVDALEEHPLVDRRAGVPAVRSTRVVFSVLVHQCS